MASVNETLETAHNAATHAAAGESKMPQIDVTSFPMQIFWLVVVFAVFYVVLAWFILPKMSRKLAARQEKMNEDILAAKRFNNEAEAAQAECNRRLVETRDISRERLRQAHDKALHILTSHESQVEIELHRQAEEAAAKLKQAELKALSELPKEIGALVSVTVKNFTGEEPPPATVQNVVETILAEGALAANAKKSAKKSAARSK